MSSLSEKRGSPLLVTCRALARQQFSREEQEVDELFVAYWHMRVSDQPFLYAFCVPLGSYQQEIIVEAQAFVLHTPHPSQHSNVQLIVERRQRGVDRFQLGGFEVEEAQTIDAQKIRGVQEFFECKLVKVEACGDHALIVGQVLRSGGAENITPQS